MNRLSDERKILLIGLLIALGIIIVGIIIAILLINAKYN